MKKLYRGMAAWAKYVVAVSRSSLANWIWLRTALAIVIVAAVTRKPTVLVPTAFLAAGVVAWRLRRFSRRIVHRRESVPAEAASTPLDMAYRNPRWANVSPLAVRPPGGYVATLSVDGTPEIEIARGLAPRATINSDLTDRLDVWLIPFATYHIDELGPVLIELRRRGVRAEFVFATTPSDAARARASVFTDEIYLYADIEHLPPATVISMMDWGQVGEILTRLSRRGTRIVSKVEGAQDFRNLDTPRRVLPYSASDCVLAQGAFDLQKVAARSEVELVGSTRIEQLAALAARGLTEKTVKGPLINLNFSYGAFEMWQRPWHLLATAGVRRAGLQPTTSVHPAVSAEFVSNPSRWPLALDLETSSHLVSRCSTAVFDALAVGRPVVYFNPHREQAWRHAPWNDHVPLARAPRELAASLEALAGSDPENRRNWLMRTFVSIDPEKPAASRIADVLTGA